MHAFLKMASGLSLFYFIKNHQKTTKKPGCGVCRRAAGSKFKKDGVCLGLRPSFAALLQK